MAPRRPESPTFSGTRRARRAAHPRRRCRLAGLVGTIQRQVLHSSRLAVPVLFHAEALSGFLDGGHMVFPSGTGLAAGWSPELIGQMSDLIRRQMRRTGMMHALSPVLDVALDPRWGRVHETFGEDPYLRRHLASPTSVGCRAAT